MENKRVDWPRSGLAVSAVAAMVALSAADVLPIDVGVLMCSLVLIGSGCLAPAAAYRAVDGRVMLAVVFAFGVSDAMDNDHTKVAGFVADGILEVFSPFGPTGVLAAVCTIACIVGSVISNNAAALLLYPIVVDLSAEARSAGGGGGGGDGLSAARVEGGLDRRQAVLVLMVASSASFLTPISYQTNLMVMAPGQYRFLDYLRFGLGLQLVCITTIVGVAHVASGGGAG